MKAFFATNKFLKIASLIVMLSLATTCVIGTTFAKYATGDNASDTARVAKWGIEVSASGTLFGEAYDKTTDNGIVVRDHATATVVADTAGVSVVAPGTKNATGFKVSISGTPEVDYTVDATTSGNEDVYLAAGSYGMMVPQYGLNAASDITGLYVKNAASNYEAATGNWVSGITYYALQDEVDLANAYYPIVWSVANTGAATAITATGKNISAIAAEMVTGLDKSGEANVASDASYTLTWEWAFEQNNGADTILGNLIAGKTNIVKYNTTDTVYEVITVADNAAKIGTDVVVANLDVSFNFSVDVFQVD